MSIVLTNPNHIDEINEWANQGWKLVTVLHRQNGWVDIYTAYFEKPISS